MKAIYKLSKYSITEAKKISKWVNIRFHIAVERTCKLEGNLLEIIHLKIKEKKEWRKANNHQRSIGQYKAVQHVHEIWISESRNRKGYNNFLET